MKNSQKSKINHFQYTYGWHLRYLLKIKNELQRLVKTILLFRHYIGIECGIERCAMLIMKKGRRETTNGVELPNQETLKTLREKEEYFGVLEWDSIKKQKRKEK